VTFIGGAKGFMKYVRPKRKTVECAKKTLGPRRAENPKSLARFVEGVVIQYSHEKKRAFWAGGTLLALLKRGGPSGIGVQLGKEKKEFPPKKGPVPAKKKKSLDN